jgi:hypothetical protein
LIEIQEGGRTTESTSMADAADSNYGARFRAMVRRLSLDGAEGVETPQHCFVGPALEPVAEGQTPSAGVVRVFHQTPKDGKPRWRAAREVQMEAEAQHKPRDTSAPPLSLDRGSELPLDDGEDSHTARQQLEPLVSLHFFTRQLSPPDLSHLSMCSLGLLKVCTPPLKVNKTIMDIASAQACLMERLRCV